MATLLIIFSPCCTRRYFVRFDFYRDRRDILPRILLVHTRIIRFVLLAFFLFFFLDNQKPALQSNPILYPNLLFRRLYIILQVWRTACSRCQRGGTTCVMGVPRVPICVYRVTHRDSHRSTCIPFQYIDNLVFFLYTYNISIRTTFILRSGLKNINVYLVS